MPQFHYQAATPQGKLIEGMMEASEERMVASRLQDQGYVPLRIAVPGQMRAKPGTGRRQLTLAALPTLPRRGKVKQRDLQILTRELATLISAGLPLDRALSVASTLADKAELKQTVA